MALKVRLGRLEADGAESGPAPRVRAGGAGALIVRFHATPLADVMLLKRGGHKKRLARLYAESPREGGDISLPLAQVTLKG